MTEAERAWDQYKDDPKTVTVKDVYMAGWDAAIEAAAQHIISEEMDYAEVYAEAIRTLRSGR